MADILQYLTYDSPFFYALTLWVMAWKGLGLWYAANSRQKYWFIALLLLNTLGILPIIYLFAFCKTPFLKELRKMRKKTPRTKKKR
jgi:hypothetical protein